MSEEKSYLASDLTNELQLPRSTINDWLTRFAAYLPSEARGKRRAYTGDALTVLREIAAWRNEGKSAYEIEQALSARYGIRPEVTLPEESKNEEPAAHNDPAASENVLPALRRPMAEVQQQISSEFDRLAARLDELSASSVKASRSSNRKNAVLVLVVILIAAAMAFFGWHALKEYRVKEASAASQRQTLVRAQGNSTERLTALTSAQSSMAKELAAMRLENRELRLEYEKKLAAQAKAGNDALAREQAKHAAEYRELRQNMAMAVTAARSASEAALKAQKEKYEAKLAALTAEREMLTRKLAEAEKTLRKAEDALKKATECHRTALQKERLKHAGMEKRLKNLTDSCRILQQQREREKAEAVKEVKFLREKLSYLQQQSLKQTTHSAPLPGNVK